MEHGLKYILTKEGLIKLLVLALGCTTFALLAASKIGMSSALKWVLAAFIISFIVSFLFLFFRVLGLSQRMECGGPCSYDGFDFLWAWFSTIWCLSASITFATNFPDKNDGEAIGSIVLAYVTTVAYAVEAFFLRLYAPANVGYVATKFGWVKTALVAFGAATFGLMVDSGYNDWNWCGNDQSCDAGTTYALVAFTVTWTVTTLMWIAHMARAFNDSENFKKAELVWAVIGVLFFWSGASCFAAYMDCKGDEFDNKPKCQKRLTGVIAGFLTGAIYVVEVVLLKP